MTGLEILARVASFIDDEDLDQEELLEQINLGLADLSLEAPYESTYSVNTVDGTRYVTIPEYCNAILGIYVDGVEIDPADSPFSEDQTAEGTPGYYYVLGSQLNLYPLPDDVYSIGIHMTRDYTSLTTLTESPTDLPEKFHVALSYWLCMQYMRTDEENEQAKDYQQEYYRYRASLALYQQNRAGSYWTTKEG